MKESGSITLFQYWDRLRDGRAAPRRTEIEPADIKTLLADTFILEKDARGEAVFRLAGTRLCAIYGRELKGFAFGSLWQRKDQSLLSRLVNSTFQAKSVVVIAFEGISKSGRRNHFELLLLPLDGGTDNPRCLGSVSAAEKPYWLGVDHITDGVIASVRVVDPDREPVFLNNRPEVAVPSLLPNRADMAPRSLLESNRFSVAGRKIRHLVVFDGGREA